MRGFTVCAQVVLSMWYFKTDSTSFNISATLDKIGIEKNRLSLLERTCLRTQLSEHWASIPKVVGSIPTAVRRELYYRKDDVVFYKIMLIWNFLV